MRVLILHASAGAGHKRAAEALGQAFTEQGATPLIRDILEFTPALFRRTYAAGYLNMVRTAPELWGYFYALTDRKSRSPLQSRIRMTLNKVNTLAFERFYRRIKPEAVVCTHFLPLEVLGQRAGILGNGEIPLCGVVTDFAAHSLWSCPNVDCYYVGSDEAARQLMRRGQPADKVKVTGIPVDLRFAAGGRSAVSKLQLGWDPDLPAILVLCGGFGVGPLLDILGAFRREPIRAQIIVVTGQNRKLRSEAEAVSRELGMPVIMYGYVTNIHDLMAVSDLVISKPGGLTSAEVLASGCPLLITDPIPGQEQRNAEYLLENGAAVRLVEPADAAAKSGLILGDPARLRALGLAANSLSRPEAARMIARDVLTR